MKSTKELARELGLLKKRSASNAAAGGRHLQKINRNRLPAGQQFSYVIVIDFESTCWKDKKNTSQEIIEFPAVLLNTSNGHLESEFQQYVMPDENPMLSEFCKEFTGITQERVESGVPLFICLNKFSSWLKQIESERHVAYNSSTDSSRKLCTFVTWSDWDLGVCLHYECQRKQLYKPSALNQWIDARAVYRSFYQRKPKGLCGALQEVGIEFAGRQHSGLDDARNTARLVWRMIQDGCQLSITKKITSGRPIAVPRGAEQRTFIKRQPDPATDATTVRASLNSSAAKKRPAKHSIDAAGMNAPFRIDEDTADLDGKHKGTSVHPNSSAAVNNKEQIMGKNVKHPLSEQQESGLCIGITTDCHIKAVKESHNKPQCACTAESPDPTRVSPIEFKTPVLPRPFFNQNSITRYGKVGQRTNTETPPINKSTPSCNMGSSGMKTPAHSGTKPQMSSRTPQSLEDSSGFKTPLHPAPSSCGTKITPPMCKCGRRSKRRVAARPGPNQGRPFYSCPGQRRSSGTALRDTTNSRTGCGFFSWESTILGSHWSPGSLGTPRTPSPLTAALLKKAARPGVGAVSPGGSLLTAGLQHT